MIVVDANVIVYRHVKGPFTYLADALLAKENDWRTSPLWRYEFSNTIATMMRNGLLDAAKAFAAMADADGQMSSRELTVPQAAAIRSSLQYRISGYDAQYIALAQMHQLTFVTADAPLARKTAKTSALLADFVARP